MNISLKQIDAFLAVASTLSFGKAAKLVHLSQPALSTNIRRLEETVGARLFDRSTRSVSLSAVGCEFHHIASGLLANVESGMERIQSFVAGKRGRLVLAVAPSLAAGFLPRLIRLFATSHPHLEIKVHDALADVCIDMVLSGTADLALTPRRAGAGELNQIELFRDQLIVLCSERHPLAARPSVRWADIRSYEHISKNSNSSVRKLVDAEYERQGAILRPAFEVEHLGTLLGLVAEGLGIGILPYSLVHAIKMDGLVWKRFSRARAPFRTICAVTLATRSVPPAVDPFIQLCLRETRRGANQRLEALAR